MDTKTNSIECVIYSKEYQFEYLYNSIALPDHSKLIELNVFTMPIIQIKTYNRIKWQFISFRNNTYYMKNKSTQEYLCAKSVFYGREMYRQTLGTEKYPHDNCIWGFELIETRKTDVLYRPEKIFYIWNVKYDKKLYPGSYFYKFDRHKRNVFLWHLKSSQSDQYKWIVNCHQ